MDGTPMNIIVKLNSFKLIYCIYQVRCSKFQIRVLVASVFYVSQSMNVCLLRPDKFFLILLLYYVKFLIVKWLVFPGQNGVCS